MQEPHCEVSTARKQPSNLTLVSPGPNYKRFTKFQMGNIRESAYKIFRSKSKRSEHSLSAKKPIRIQEKLKEIQQSQKIQNYSNKKEPKKKKIDRREKSVILINHEQKILQGDPDFTKKFISEQLQIHQSPSLESFSMKGKLSQQQEIKLLRSIWQNLKQLKENNLFIVEIIQMELIMQKMLAKIEDSSHFVSQRITDTEQKMQEFLTATCQTQIALTFEKTLKSNEYCQEKQKSEYQSKRMIYIVEQEKKESHSSMSLKIENEQLHSKEFLHSYHDDICENRLKDITYFDYKRNSLESFQNSKQNSYNECSSQSHDESQRVILKTIVKKNKKNTPINQQSSLLSCDQLGTICRKDKFQQRGGPYCQLFDCERVQGSKQNILSSEGSQSKRSALNQIILMLNQKYHKNLKCVSPKIYL